MLTGRELNTGHSVADYLQLKPEDRFYTCMPLYHGAAHGLCVTPSIHAGCTVILSRKFSHSRFWPEVRESKSNIIQYVGELCRYLLNAPPNPLDKEHSVKMAWGNGMRPDVWEPFRQRFGIEIINELYAATDGLGSSFNANRGEFGRNAIGIRGLLWHLQNSSLETRVRVDPDTEELAKDENGFAIRCGVNEPGETVYQMDPATQEQAFAGYYQNTGATEKRKVSGLFKKGDLWYVPLSYLHTSRLLTLALQVPIRRHDAPRQRQPPLLCRPPRRHIPLEGTFSLSCSSLTQIH